MMVSFFGRKEKETGNGESHGTFVAICFDFERENRLPEKPLRLSVRAFGRHPAAFVVLFACALLLTSGVNTAFSQTRMDLQSKLMDGMNENVLSEPQVPAKKSPTLAAFASFVVPGLGELYAGRYDVGKYSTIAEVSLWVIYTGIELYSNQVRNDAINYARVYSGAQVAGKSSQFFVNIGNFLNTTDYNIKKIHDGTYGLIYNDPAYQWQWQSDAERAKFKNLRIKADSYLNYGRYTLAVIFLNHLVSAINAARLVSNLNASAVSHLSNAPQTEGVYLKLAASF